ncbi:hypothetical protein Bca52824_029682 [Brassica carinata]|uniref:Uncharacterized protein n=1 Tax=Brassica carinata TaxID=52824 RepID=A0A8X7S7K4_BRACI|nr:hypothetical protein Bca52824_029682 [Brassica carinata]
MFGDCKYGKHKLFDLSENQSLCQTQKVSNASFNRENPSVSGSEISRVTRKFQGKSQGLPESRRGRRDVTWWLSSGSLLLKANI